MGVQFSLGSDRFHQIQRTARFKPSDLLVGVGMTQLHDLLGVVLVQDDHFETFFGSQILKTVDEKFVFFKDTRGMCRVQTVPPKGSGFDMRVPLSKAWRGLRSEELKKITDFTDMEFVHHSGFIGGAWSIESAVRMAEISLKEHTEAQQQQQKVQESKTA